MNKTYALPLLIGILSLGMLSSLAESLPASSKPLGERPKFRSKIHIPVQLAKEVTPLPPAGYELVFSDEFNGDSLDTNRWGFRLGDKMLSAQQPDNVSVKDGNLVIALRKESVRSKDYTGGGVISRQKFVYGYYEARFKTPPAEGWHTAFWSMRHRFGDTSAPLPLLELDFCEQDGGDPHYFSFGIINQSRLRPEKKSPVVECRTMGHRGRAGHLGGIPCVVVRVHTRDHTFLFQRETDQRSQFLRISPRRDEYLVQRHRQHVEGRPLGG
jgi:hypothetical protein